MCKLYTKMTEGVIKVLGEQHHYYIHQCHNNRNLNRNNKNNKTTTKTNKNKITKTNNNNNRSSNISIDPLCLVAR